MRTFFDFFRADAQMLTRNRQALFWTFFFPVLLMCLLGVVFGHGYGGNFKLAIVKQDDGTVANVLVQAFGGVKGITVSQTGEADALQKLKDAKVNGVLVLPAGLDQKVRQTGSTFALPFYYDNSNLTTAGQVTSITGQVVDAVGNRMANITPPITIAPQGVKAKGFNYLDFLVPGIIALAIMQTGVFGVAGVLVTYKEKGILRRLKATPLPLASFVTANIAVRVATGIIQTGLILAVGILLFHVKLHGSLVLVVIMSILGSCAFVSLGFAIASFSRNTEVAQALMNVVQMPMMFLSGIFFPMDNAPAWIQPVVKAMPLKYLADAMRNIIIDDHGLWFVRLDVIVLVAVAIVFVGLGMRFFTWD